MDTSVLLAAVQSKSDFRKEDFPSLIELFEERTFRKGEMIFKAGDITRCTYFVLKGCLRLFYVNGEGAERIIYFATEGWWAGDLMSMMNQVPTTMNLHALEDCEVLSIIKPNIEYAIKNLPEFAIYQFRNQTRTVSYFKESIARDIIESPESKYLRFTHEHPDLLQRLPLYHIASYLGITPETLSRIRKKTST